MDHVPYPKNAATPKLEVPYICGDLEDYDGQGFMDYPVRRGWSQSANRFNWMDCSQAVAAKRAQNWLYFGLLREILGQRYCKDTFLKSIPGEHGYFIDTSGILKYLDSWTRNINMSKMVRGDSTRGRILKRSEKTFVEANLQSELLDRAFASELLDTAFESKVSRRDFYQCHKVTLAIKILLQTMRSAACNIGGIPERPTERYSNRVLPSRLCMSQMVQMKLCSKQIQDLYNHHSSAMYFYLAALPRPLQESRHPKCTIHQCIANNVDEVKYKTQHTQDHCDCQFAGPDAHKIRQLINNGEIPLISLGTTPSGDPEFEVVKAQPGIKYTAISHVWSGGLGNFKKNELPRCQLLHLHDLVLKLRDHKPQVSLAGPKIHWKRLQWDSLPRWTGIRVPILMIPNLSLPNLPKTLLGHLRFPVEHPNRRAVFWMDTLCIVDEADSVIRAKAISKMALTYAAAEEVLVLDPELQKTKLKGLSQEQICAHVSCCAWLTRSWTLQEARLSRRWFAQFSDGLFDPAEVHRMVNTDTLPVAYYKSAASSTADFASELIEWYDGMPVMRRYSIFSHPENALDHPLVVFIQAWNQLKQRSTSKPKDTHGIFANMLNLSASEVLALPHAQRMKAILRTQEQIPLCLLYNPAPKIHDPQNQWIPDFPGGYDLHLQYGVFTVDTGEIVLHEDTATPIGFLVDISSPRTEKLRLINSVTSEIIWVEQCQDGAAIDFQATGGVTTCYLLADLKAARLYPRNQHHGARFAVLRREGNTLHLVHEHCFKYHLHHLEYSESDSDGDFPEYPLIRSEMTAPDQLFRLECGR